LNSNQGRRKRKQKKRNEEEGLTAGSACSASWPSQQPASPASAQQQAGPRAHAGPAAQRPAAHHQTAGPASTMTSLRFFLLIAHDFLEYVFIVY